jgi:hypothetical protein
MELPMLRRSSFLSLLAVVPASLLAQATPDTTRTMRPFAPIDTLAGLVTVSVTDFASLPDIGGIPARPMLLIDEPGTRRLFVNDMRGPIYSVSYDGRTVVPYIDINDSTWGVQVNSQGRERGMQSFAFHPQFAQSGTPGYGKFYTWTDARTIDVPADFLPLRETNTHHTVLHEWTARTATARTYDGGPPREVLRFQQPYANHNGGMAAFNPLARPGSADFGLLYLGIGDGGSGGDPQNHSQNLTNGFGKIFRIDPLGRNSRNGKYGVPASNPFAGGRRPDALPEIYAYGARNPQRFGWDPANGNMFFADIGQNMIEEVGLVPAGANLGWNVWEGSFRFGGRGGGVPAAGARSDPAVTYPIVEWAHTDSLFLSQTAVTGVHVVRDNSIPSLRNKVIFGDNPSGEVFWFDADNLPTGGSSGMHRILFRVRGGEPKKLLTLIREKNAEQGKPAATRADMRLGVATDGRIFLLNKADGTIRLIGR